MALSSTACNRKETLQTSNQMQTFERNGQQHRQPLQH